MTTQAQITAAVVAVLKPLVGDRVSSRFFPQKADGQVWPAIRMTFISAAVVEDICGDGGEQAADYRIQIDVADDADKGEASFLGLCSSVLTAIASLGGVYRWAGMQDGYDEELKVFTRSLDFVVYLSS